MRTEKGNIMKAQMVCLCALIYFVPMCVRIYGQSPEETSQPNEPVINLGLADVDAYLTLPSEIAFLILSK